MDNKEISVCIVIPIYKLKLNHNEEIALRQCRSVLGKYDLYFLKPEGMKIEWKIGDNEYFIDTQAENLTSRKKYSDYVLSLEFYDLFSKYDFMLIYQLDAFVFEDRLLEFCQKDYDYIGAPWPYGLECHTRERQLWYVGNGGFSLRKIVSFRNWIIHHQKDVEYQKMILPEDMVIAAYGKDYLKIAPFADALQFAFDLNPVDCYHMNKDQLPFGCHGWHKFGKDFWKQQIDAYGYNVILDNNDSQETEILSNGKLREVLMRENLKIDLVKKSLKCLIQNYDTEVYVFGAGQQGLSFINIVKNSEIKINCFIDNDKEKIGKKIEQFEIKSVGVLRTDRRPAILIALMNPEPIVSQLEHMGYQSGKDFTTTHELQQKMIQMNGI